MADPNEGAGRLTGPAFGSGPRVELIDRLALCDETAIGRGAGGRPGRGLKVATIGHAQEQRRLVTEQIKVLAEGRGAHTEPQVDVPLPAAVARTPPDDEVRNEGVREVVRPLDLCAWVEPPQRVANELMNGVRGLVPMWPFKRSVQLAHETHAASSTIRDTTALRSSRPMIISSTRLLTIASHSRD